MENEVKVELKYCERCGGLWLRRAGDPQVYCAPCAPAMREMAGPKKPVRGTFAERVQRELGGVACA